MILRIPPVSRRERLSLRSLVTISIKDYPNLAESISDQWKITDCESSYSESFPNSFYYQLAATTICLNSWVDRCIV